MTSITGERFVSLKKGDSLFTSSEHKIVPVTFDSKKADGSYFVMMHKDFCQYSSVRIQPCKLYDTEKDAAEALISYDENLIEELDNGAGTEMTLDGIDKKWTKDSNGNWIEENLSENSEKKWWKFWKK